jgi:DNA-binding CsgD family transcriptional regulator
MHLLTVLILADSAFFTGTLQPILSRASGGFARWIHGGEHPEALRGGAETDALLIAPRHWEEMEAWLPQIDGLLRALPWLVWSELCLSGMFLTGLEHPCCTLFAPHWEPADLPLPLRLLVTRHAVCPPARLPTLFLEDLPAGATRPVHLTIRQFECGCAVGMGLRNRRMGQLLFLAESTVRDHLNNLFRALNIHDREELAHLFRHTLSHLPPPF